jgi:Spy/CpxP family protein refolding chaperone
MRIRYAAALCTLFLLALPAARAQDSAADVTDMKALRAAVSADKRALVAATLNLTPVEAKKFWPLYDAYQRTLDAASRERALAFEDLLSRDRPVSDLFAKTLANELVAADEAEIKARRKLQKGVMKVLPPKQAARYLQLESKIRAYQMYDIATTFPLIR